jgi:predicted DNA-binding protein with PD1-like motif
MITLAQANTAQTRAYVGTLTGGVGLHDALAQVAQTHAIQSGAVFLLGGLTRAEFTAYDFVTQTRHAPQVLEGALEIVGGHGTLSLLEGAPHVHLHLLVSQRTPTGSHVTGGHCALALAWAVEFTLLAFDGVPVTRGAHPQTGLYLWQLPPLT